MRNNSDEQTYGLQRWSVSQHVAEMPIQLVEPEVSNCLSLKSELSVREDLSRSEQHSGMIQAMSRAKSDRNASVEFTNRPPLSKKNWDRNRVVNVEQKSPKLPGL